MVTYIHVQVYYSYTTVSDIPADITAANPSIAPAVLPASPPPLLPQLTVELGLTQLPINVVVRVAEPHPEFVPAPHYGPPLRNIGLEVLRAGPAGV